MHEKFPLTARGLCLVLLSLSASGLRAQTTSSDTPQPPATATSAPAAPLESVQVVGLKHPASARYATLAAGLDAFDKHRKLAPQASLRFSLRPVPGGPPVQPDGLIFKLESGSLSLPVPLDAELSFTLPEPALLGDAARDAELVANRRAGSLRALAQVRSPGLPPEVRRLGDLRLQCEVNWALEKEGMSFMVRGALNLAGGICRSSYIAISFGHQGQKLAEATLSEGERRQPVSIVSDGMAYVPPLWDKTWSDEAMVTLRPAGAP